MARMVITVVVVAIFGVGILAIWMWLAGDDDGPQLDPLQMLLAEKAVKQLGTELALPKGFDTVTEPRLGGKYGPEVAKLLRDELTNRGWNLVSEASFKKDHPTLSKLWETMFGHEAGKMADERFRGAGIHGFVRGSAVFLDQEGKTILDVKVRVEDSGTGFLLDAKNVAPFVERSLWNLEYYRLTVDGMGVGWRALLWLFALLLLPLLCYPIAAKGLATDKNVANLALWLGFTGADLTFAFALTGFRAPGFFGAIGLLIALALALFYNYGILTEIDDLRK